MELKQMLLISGSGRKCGKTTLACKVISEYSDQHLLTGLKIGSHWHDPTSGLILVHLNRTFRIFRETNLNSLKDTSRMLQSGAVAVFYIQAGMEGLKNAILWFLENVSKGHPVICESPALREIVTPGLFFVCHNQNVQDPKSELISQKEIADLFTIYDGSTFDPGIPSLTLDGDHWTVGE